MLNMIWEESELRRSKWDWEIDKKKEVQTGTQWEQHGRQKGDLSRRKERKDS